MRADLSLALVVLGTAICVAAALGALVTRRLYDRVHYLAPITSVATPLLAAGLAVRDGLDLTSGQILLVAVLLALSGPALTAATGRLIAQDDGRLEVENKVEYEPER